MTEYRSPTPSRNRDSYYPDCHHDYQSYPFSHNYRGHDYQPRRPRYNGESRGERRVKELQHRSLGHHGDLGWTLDYATAWCYKYLIGNQTEVADVIDKARSLEVEKVTLCIIFDYIDKAMFGHELQGVVYLTWKTQVSHSPGTTSAPGTVAGIPRICIELNKLPFENGGTHIDDLLDALIHQIIQAFFLVCCGPQPKDAKQDGRLAHGLHFGVIFHTIMDISRQCQDRKLQLVFYAATRRNEAHRRGQPFNPYDYGMGNYTAHSEQSWWISVDPQGGITSAAPADGQSHCCHDNRKIQSAQIKNWQVENYSLAIGLSMEEKGDVIYDFCIDGQLVPKDRLKGPLSATFVELIWDMKRIMVSREKTLKLPSIRTPLVKDGKFDLRVPECPLSVFRLLYDFMQFRETWQEPGETLAKSTPTHTVGPPVLRNPYALSIEPSGMLNHIRVFKAA